MVDADAAQKEQAKQAAEDEAAEKKKAVEEIKNKMAALAVSFMFLLTCHSICKQICS